MRSLKKRGPHVLYDLNDLLFTLHDSHENVGGHHRLYDTLGFNATGPTCGDSHENVRENARGDSREWGRCLSDSHVM